MPRGKQTKTKKGAWSNQEAAYVRENHGKISTEEMAKHLNREVKTLLKWIETSFVPKPPAPQKVLDEEKADIRANFRNTLAWKKLKDEFTTDELSYFEEEYIDLIQQFKDDVLKTEEQQIRKAITLDILMRRNMTARKKLLEDIGRVEVWQEKAVREHQRDRAKMAVEDRRTQEEFLLNLETQLQSLRAAEQSKTKEFADLDNRHQKLMEALKATRDQRISRVESSKQSWLEVLKELSKQETMEREGRMMELMRDATKREHDRLSRRHVYDDGSEDKPILSAETVKDEEE